MGSQDYFRGYTSDLEDEYQLYEAHEFKTSKREESRLGTKYEKDDGRRV